MSKVPAVQHVLGISTMNININGAHSQNICNDHNFSDSKLMNANEMIIYL